MNKILSALFLFVFFISANAASITPKTPKLVDGCYEISSVEELYALDSLVKRTNFSAKSRCAFLTKDLVVNKDVLDEDGNLKKDTSSYIPWTPIDMRGSFRGNGHKISGLVSVNDTATYVGVFRSSSKVSDLDVEDSYFKGRTFVGGLAGYANDSIKNCHVKASVHGVSRVGGIAGQMQDSKEVALENSSFEGLVTGNTIVGGLVGEMNENINNSFFKGQVKGDSLVGGIVGEMSGYASRNRTEGHVEGRYCVGGIAGEASYPTATFLEGNHNAASVKGDSIVGGIVGYLGSTIMLNRNSGNVEGRVHVGGLVGENRGFPASSYNEGSVKGIEGVGGIAGLGARLVSSCYNVGSVTGTKNVGGIVGVGSGGVSAVFNMGAVSGSDSVGALVGAVDKNGYLPTYSFALSSTATHLVGNRDTIVDGFLTAISFSKGDVLKVLQDHPGVATWIQGDKYPILDTVFAYQKAPEGGSEFRRKVFEIENAAQLYYFSMLANSGLDTKYKKIRLTKDIVFHRNLLESDCIKSGRNCMQWYPISYNSKDFFKGEFDGNGHTISGVFVRRSADTLGFFNFAEASIVNLRIEDSYIKGDDAVGGIVGENYGLVANSYFHGSVVGDESVGGLVGFSRGTVVNSHHSGLVSGSVNVGGLVGFNLSLLALSYNEGEVANTWSESRTTGGLVGENHARVIYSYNLSSVQGYGSLVGRNYGKDTKVYGCYNMGKSLGGGNVFGSSSYGDAPLSHDNYKLKDGRSQEEEEGVFVRDSSDFQDGTVVDELNRMTQALIWEQGDGHPVLKQTQKPKQENGVFLISNRDELLWFANYVNTGSSDKNTKAALVDDIVFNENLLSSCPDLGKDCDYYTIDPIGLGPIPSFISPAAKYNERTLPFAGELDGRGHTISGLAIVSTDSTTPMGLFKSLESTAHVKNVHIKDSYLASNAYVGAIAGSSEGLVDRCTFEGSFGSIGRDSKKGMFVGDNEGAVFACYGVSNSGWLPAYRQKYSGTPPEGFNITMSQDEYKKGIFKEEQFLDSVNLGMRDLVWKLVDGSPSVQVNEPEKKDGAYQISDLRDLAWYTNYAYSIADETSLAEMTNDIAINKDVSKSSCFKNREACDLVSNIRFEQLKGTFDGKGHSVSGIYDSYFVNFVQKSSVLKNLEIGDSYFTCVSGKKSGEGCREPVALVQNNSGTVENVSLLENTLSQANRAAGIVYYNRNLVKDCKFAGIVEGDTLAGGLVGDGEYLKKNVNVVGGKVSGSISGQIAGGCMGNATYSHVEGCEFTGKVSGSVHAGGIAGVAGRNIVSCLSAGIVQGSLEKKAYGTGGIVGYYDFSEKDTLQGRNISQCVNASVVKGRNVGGIVGYSERPIHVKDSYNVGTIVGRNYVGGILGRGTTVTIQNVFNYDDMNFSNPGHLILGVGGFSDTSRNLIALPSERMTLFDSEKKPESASHRSLKEFSDGTVLKLLNDGRGDKSPWTQGKKFPILGKTEIEPVKIPEDMIPDEDWYTTDVVTAMQKMPAMGMNVLSRNIQVFNAPEGSDFALLDMMGRVVARGRTELKDFEIHVPRAGSYLLKVGAYSRQVNVR